MEWISVKDGKPEEGLLVLVFLKDQRRIGTAIAYWFSGQWWGGIGLNQQKPHIDIFYDSYKIEDVPSDCVTHWMALPELPKKL